MRGVLLLLVLIPVGAAHLDGRAQEPLWKCGDVFTDRPTNVAGRHCTPATAASLATAMPRLTRMAVGMPHQNTRVEPAVQAARDRDVRSILETELARALARRTAQVSAQVHTPPATYANELRRVDIDVESLRREISRLPKDNP